MNQDMTLRTLLQEPWSRSLALVLLLFYVAAIGILLYQRDIKGLFVGLVTMAFVLALAALSLKLTATRTVQIAVVSKPWLGLAVWVLLEIVSLVLAHSRLFPPLTIGNLEVGDAILRKLLMMTLIPLLFLWIKGDSLSSMGLNIDHWREDLKFALLIGGIGLGPIFLFAYLNWGPTLFQQVTPAKALLGFPLALVFYFLHTGLPEEFFYRSYLQGHLAMLLQSQWGAIILTALIFGLPHMLFWTEGGKPPLSGLAYAVLTQVSVALLFGVLYARTQSLILVVLLHTWIDAIIGLGYVMRRVWP